MLEKPEKPKILIRKSVFVKKIEKEDWKVMQVIKVREIIKVVHIMKKVMSRKSRP